ncbi:MAG: peptidoglycan-binding protein [Solirubrobacteraceae bacterium]|jgi:hypothetical protein
MEACALHGCRAIRQCTSHRRGRCPRGLLRAGLTVLACAALASSAAAAGRDPLAGRGMWIWYLSRSDGGDISSIVAAARQYGLSTVIVKSGDGAGVWSQFNAPLVAALHAAGLRVCGWQYVYGDNPVAEADVGAATVRAGADCLVVDAESSYQGKYVQAQTYISSLRSLIGAGFPVALAGLPYVDYHPGFPYSVFLGPSGAQYDMPQMYWLDIGASVDQVYAHTFAYNTPYGRPIVPLGQAYGNPTPGQMIRFRQDSRAYGAAGVSWWDWAWTQTSGEWGAISQPAGQLATADAVASEADMRTGLQGDLVVWAQEHLISAGYRIAADGDFGPTTLVAVVAFQRAHGLTADGVIGPVTWRALLRYAPAPVRFSATAARVASAAGFSLTMPIPKSARLPARRTEIAAPAEPGPRG